MIGYRVDIRLRCGYELPPWHKRSHGTLESAQAEVRKLREWGGSGAGSAIRDLVITEDRAPVPGGPPMREGNNPRTGIAYNE